jgi:hypothetical protein
MTSVGCCNNGFPRQGFKRNQGIKDDIYKALKYFNQIKMSHYVLDTAVLLMCPDTALFIF